MMPSLRYTLRMLRKRIPIGLVSIVSPRTNHFERFISAQNHYSLLERGAEKELLPAAEAFGSSSRAMNWSQAASQASSGFAQFVCAFASDCALRM